MRLTTSGIDAVDGSSTGTSVPWMWALLRLPLFRGAGFCELVIRLQTPNSPNSEAKSPIVSGGYLKYSRVRETGTGD